MNDAIITVIAQRAHKINQCMLITERHKNQFLSHGENITPNAVLAAAQIPPLPLCRCVLTPHLIAGRVCCDGRLAIIKLYVTSFSVTVQFNN